MTTYLANTFSPLMLEAGSAHVRPIRLHEAKGYLEPMNWATVISHENTAELLTRLLGFPVEFNRVNLSVRQGDNIVVMTPAFRAEQARELTDEEIKSVPIRCFYVRVR